LVVTNYNSPGKRQRQADQARKKEQKAQERMANRGRGPKELPIVSAEELSGNLPSIEDAMRAIENPGSVERFASTISVRLFVGNLGDAVTENDLRNAFGAFGLVSDAVVMVDRDTGNSRGFGFVTMSSRKDAPKAIEALNGSELEGQSIVVNVATERGR
jgi:RNA recognition motif-containing protein